MPMLKSDYFIVNLNVFPFDIMFSINETDDVLLKRLRKYKINEEELLKFMYNYENSNGRTCIFSTNHTVIRLTQKDDKCDLDLIGTLAHEIFHAVTFILNEIGIKYELGVSDEVYAYCIGHVTKCAFSNMDI